jgi:chemotaxis protein methyltransferase CheR
MNAHDAPQHGAMVAGVVRAASGLAVLDEREEVVRMRLAPRLRALGIDLAQYARAIAEDAQERGRAIELLTTGHTTWWREPDHFDDLRERVLRPAARTGARVRIWCVGCSTGEEPYGVALCLRRELGEHADAAILATDISASSIAFARRGRYPERAFAPVPEAERSQVATPVDDGSGEWEVRPELRHLVHFARHNLTENWPMSGPFDAIFCRNVLVHLVPEARSRIAGQLAQRLASPGTLYLGQGELLEPHLFPLRQLRPSIHVA